MTRQREERKEGRERKESGASRFLLSLLFLFPLVCFPLAGCSDAFDPFVESDQAFALYGFLDARRDTQFVRVQPVTETADDAGTVEATVTSTDLATGERLAWQDSLVERDDGTLGIVFFAAFRPLAGRQYRIEAVQPGTGAASAVEVGPPAEPPLLVGPATPVDSVVTQTLTVASATRPSALVVTYTLRREGTVEPFLVAVRYSAEPGRRADGFAVFVRLTRDAEAILSRFEEGTEVTLLSLGLAYDLENEVRVPVVGGLGEVGAAAAFEAGWTLARDAVRLIGFEDGQG